MQTWEEGCSARSVWLWIVTREPEYAKFPLLELPCPFIRESNPRIFYFPSPRVFVLRSSLFQSVSNRAEAAFKPLDSVFLLFYPFIFITPFPLFSTIPTIPSISGPSFWLQTAVTNVVAKFSSKTACVRLTCSVEGYGCSRSSTGSEWT